MNFRFLSATQIEIKLLHIWVFNSDAWSLVEGIDIPYWVTAAFRVYVGGYWEWGKAKGLLVESTG